MAYENIEPVNAVKQVTLGYHVHIMTASDSKPLKDGDLAHQSNNRKNLNDQQLSSLAKNIKTWGVQIGFDKVGISDTNLSTHEQHLEHWLKKNMHGEMGYMSKHGRKRSRPELLVEGTQRVISVRLDYAPSDIDEAESVLQEHDTAYISRYALGRDYHKVLRKKLKQLAALIANEIGDFGHRVFTDSAPVLEKAIAEKAGLGWIGKHSNLLDSKTGSWFFLGELYVDIPLPIDKPASNHCGSCQKCINACPTGAIVAPYSVDARKCISYLTIELKGSIPEEFRSAIGNRIYGCDDCQIVCPWNKFAQSSKTDDFTPREHLTNQKLLDLFNWTEQEFLDNTEGTAIRRIGYDAWLRNVAIALGNTKKQSYFTDKDKLIKVQTNPSEDEIKKIVVALNERLLDSSNMVREHICWAISELTE